MNVVIAGGGIVGSHLATELSDEGADVTLIERDPERARVLSNRLDCLVITGMANNLETLRSAGADEADHFIAVTASDEVNMISCGMVASEFAAGVRIARIRNIDYSAARVSGKQFLGIDYVVDPEVEATRQILTSVKHGAMSDVLLFETSDLQMRSIPVTERFAFVDLALHEVMSRADVSLIVAVIVRGQKYFIPDGDTVIREGDMLYMVGREEDFTKLFPKLGKQYTWLEDIIIVGGGKVGQLTAEGLIGEREPTRGGRRRKKRPRKRRRVQFVERNYERCKELSARFPNALVTNADVTDEGIFHEERLGGADLLIATTENQELNMVTALYGRSLGVSRSMVLVKSAAYANIAAQLKIDVSVSVKNAVIDSILSRIRSGRLRSVRSIFDGRVQVVEVTLGERSRLIGHTLTQLRLPEDTLFVSVKRDGEVAVPSGAYVPAAGDQLVAVCRKGSLEKLEELCDPPSTQEEPGVVV